MAWLVVAVDGDFHAPCPDKKKNPTDVVLAT